MFRTFLTQSTRCVASSSSTSFFHTSAALAAAPKKRLTNKIRAERKAAQWNKANANRPSVILGTKSGEEWKWEQCDLAKVLVNEAELATSPAMDTVKVAVGTVHLPKQFAYGVSQEEAKLLFDKLPDVSAQQGVRDQSDVDELNEKRAIGEQRELKKANEFARAIDLRNADADGISYENRRRIILEFSSPENPFDPGRTEVQAALLTYRIRNLWSHLLNHKRDVGNRLGLRKLVHHRAKILKYLKRTHRQRYDILLERLALEPESVEGELIV